MMNAAGPSSPSSPSCRWWGPVFILIVNGGERRAVARKRPLGGAVDLAHHLPGLAAAVVRTLRPRQAGFQFVEKAQWIPALGIAYHMGVDGISMLFVLLSTC